MSTTFASYDGTRLASRLLGHGTPVVCLLGGPMQDATYLGGLGGLSERLRLILVDPRGTGDSATPIDDATYRCDRQVDDLEALRVQQATDRDWPDPAAPRAALGRLSAPVLVVAGEVEVSSPPRVVAELAGLFAESRFVTLSGGGHYPWLDDAPWFAETVSSFLA